MRFSLLVLLSRRMVPVVEFRAAFCSLSIVYSDSPALVLAVRGAAGGVGLHFRIHRHQGVVLAVHIEARGGVIDVLVSGADNIMVDQRSAAGILFGAGMHAWSSPARLSPLQSRWRRHRYRWCRCRGTPSQRYSRSCRRCWIQRTTSSRRSVPTLGLPHFQVRLYSGPA